VTNVLQIAGALLRLGRSDQGAVGRKKEAMPITVLVKSPVFLSGKGLLQQAAGQIDAGKAPFLPQRKMRLADLENKSREYLASRRGLSSS